MRPGFICEFCVEQFFSSGGECAEHEKTCEGNPKARGCFTCANLGVHWDQSGSPRYCKKGQRTNRFGEPCEEWKPEEGGDEG